MLGKQVENLPTYTNFRIRDYIKRRILAQKKKIRRLSWGSSILADGIETLWGHTGSIQEMHTTYEESLKKG